MGKEKGAVGHVPRSLCKRRERFKKRESDWEEISDLKPVPKEGETSLLEREEEEGGPTS